MVCSPCFTNFEARERAANNAFACPECTLTYKLKPQFGSLVPPAMTFHRMLLTTNRTLQSNTLWRTSTDLNDEHGPSHPNYTDPTILSRTHRAIFNWANHLQSQLKSYNIQSIADGKPTPYDRIPTSWFPLPAETVAHLKALHLSDRAGQTTPYIPISYTTTYPLRPPVDPQILDDAIHIATETFSDWFGGYDYAVESGRDRTPLNRFPLVDEHGDPVYEDEQFSTTFECAPEIVGFVGGSVGPPPEHDGDWERARWWAVESKVRWRVAEVLIEEHLLTGRIGWDAPAGIRGDPGAGDE